MSALRAQEQLALADAQGMKDSYDANEEVAAVRTQLASLTHGTLPPDVADAAKALDAKLATLGAVGGRAPRGGGGGFGGFGGGPARAPGSVLAFYTINGLFYTALGPLTQNGIDMPPTKAEVDTWESDCKEYAASANAWKTMLSADLVTFNSLLTKNNLPPLKIASTAVAVPATCAFASPASKSGAGR
jgi:hypothetical protein